MIKQSAFATPTVVKLDIEGAEFLALRGARQLLHGDEAPRVLFIEVHDSFLPEFDSSADEVLAMLRDAGYTTALYEEQRWGERHLILTR